MKNVWLTLPLATFALGCGGPDYKKIMEEAFPTTSSVPWYQDPAQVRQVYAIMNKSGPSDPPGTAPTTSPPASDVPPASDAPAAKLDLLLYYAAVYCVAPGHPGEDTLNVWAFHVVGPVSMSVDAAMDRIGDRVGALKAETSGADDGGRWCHTGTGGGFTLDGRSFGSAVFDLQQALSSKSGGYVPSDWYPDYRFATVKSDVVVDMTE